MPSGDRAVYLGYRLGAAIARTLPLPAARLAAAAGSRVMVRTMHGRRQMIARHLQRVYDNGLAPEQLDAKVAEAFASYGRYWLESFRLPGTTARQLDAATSWSGLEHFDAALDAGNGVIIALPHLGGWDTTGAWFASLGAPITVVVEPVEPPALFEWFAELRRGYGVNVVPLGSDAGTAVLRALKAGEVVGLVCDRDIQGNGIEVDFFGERTTLPSGPATLALRTGAPLLPAGMYFEGRDSHFGLMRPPIATDRRGSLRDDVARVTQALAGELEYLIRRAPEQWHLFQPNWPSDFEYLENLAVSPWLGASA